MGSKVTLITLWSLGFLILNFGAKKLTYIIVLDKGFNKLIYSLLVTPWSYIVVLLYTVCAMLYMLLLKIMPISIAGPTILSLGIVYLSLLGMFVFKENVVNLWQISGIVLCLAGILCLQGVNG